MQNHSLKLKTFHFLLVFLTFAFLLLSFNLSGVNATDMESSRYQIKYGNINISSGDMTSPNSYNKLSTTVGQLAANQFASSGYIVKAGFQYWHAIVPFSFSISNSSINLGTLVPNVFPAISDELKTNLTVSFGSAGQYQVTAAEEGPLRTMTDTSIPDTSCDGRGNSCTESLASPWTSSLTYGFGYNMSGEDIPPDFVSSDYYRPFPDTTTDDSPAVVMTSANVTVDLTSKPKDITHLSTVTFRANISPLQEAGSYNTVISFVATPGY